jgi:O-antigen/teichoic acid export membrane protein
MLFTMVISLYTVRVVLNTLGVVDFGIYNVVGGIVTMFAFLSNVMSNASQRFFAFDLGQNNTLQLEKTFSTISWIYIIIAVIILLLGETVGLWFLKEKMTIPEYRMNAAIAVYQFSILSFIVTVLNIPCVSIIIANENMKMFSLMSMLDVSLKFAIIYPLITVPYDKLKLYAILMFLVTLFIALVYRFVCIRKYNIRFKFVLDRSSFRIILTYSGWNLFGAITSILNNQGINILLNIFFGPVVNASRTIAYQVNSAVTSFSNSFYTAINPQIIKSYANGDKNRMFTIVLTGSRFAFFLLLMLSLPIFIEMKAILSFWLSQVNEYMIVFTRIVIIYSLINIWENPLTQVVRATGNIRRYQIMVGSVTLLTVPISYLLFKLNYPPSTAFIVLTIIYFIVTFVRLTVLKQLIEFPIRKYIKNVLFVNIIVALGAAIAPVLCHNAISNSILRLIMVFLTSFISVLLFVYFIGLNNTEKEKVIFYLKKHVRI